MKENWMINRIGLVDFWYYDDQEFTFIEGRMLLRGSNGSGKSVTMQSVVPLLLDGNTRPERLDPFGSRDRKMSNYLLEEGDGREERTGYLYMEFRKQGLDIFHTIGMGIRAKRGKNLDTWYFYISDGRRINRDFPLYKESDGKITLSRRELEFKIGEGGKVFTSQQDYMEYVNRQIFGFETVDDYKELIDLLIQLRTPKLSKDFKPSVINEILSDSLQPLSEDDLRPMSEAIENMDALNSNLDNKKSSLQAADKINKQYIRYNEYVLKEKAELYLESVSEQKTVSKEIEAARETLISSAEQKEAEIKKKTRLEQEREVLEQEKEELNASDAVSLKQREIGVTSRLNESKESLSSKKQQLDEKQDTWREFENRAKKEKERKEISESEIDSRLTEMSDNLSVVFLDEHDFFEKEMREHMQEEISFDSQRAMVDKTMVQLEQGTELLKECERIKSKKEEILQRYDQAKKYRNTLERQMTEAENLLQESLQEQKEKIYEWNHNNQELKLSDSILHKINQFLEVYDTQSDYFEVKNMVSSCYSDYNYQLQTVKREQTDQISKEEENMQLIITELEEWENQKDPEPELSIYKVRNREKLDRLNIPYDRFYEAVDFEGSLSEEVADRMEEALLEMGILDALIVDKAYKTQILELDPGLSDRYIFTDGPYQSNNLSTLLSVSEGHNDLFGNQRILSVLGSIGLGDVSASYVRDDGTYGLGILEGTITGEYKAKYIGVNARARYREKQIELLQEQRRQAEVSLADLKERQEKTDLRIRTLEREHHTFPSGENLREKVNQIELLRFQLQKQNDIITDLEKQIVEHTEQIRNFLIQAEEISEKIYIDCRLDLFTNGLSEIRIYDRQLNDLRTEHMKYLQILEGLVNLNDNMDRLDEDLDQIRYEISKYEKQIQKEEMELSSIHEQLLMTNYSQIQEKLSFCIERLKKIPVEIEASIKAESHYDNGWKNAQDLILRAEPELIRITEKTRFLQENLKKEIALEYTTYADLKVIDPQYWDTKVNQMHTSLAVGFSKETSKDSLSDKMNQVFYENRGYLTDFNPVFQNVFEHDYREEFPQIHPKRLEITGRYRGERVKLGRLITYLEEEINEIENLIKSGDKELFEDILANTIGRKIRGKINTSIAWVEKMNDLMDAMNTSSGLKLSLRWRSKTAEIEDQLDTKELVELLKKDARLMDDSEFDKLSMHFRSKVTQARRNTRESLQPVSFFAIMRETLDYRKWFEFQLYFQKSGEAKKELTNSMFGTFSGGEKAMSMYVPLFSAVVAKYEGARPEAPRIVSLDEAFAGVDNRNIRDMFRLMSEFRFNFIINSQVLWGDCDTLDGLAIYQLYRLNNQKFVTVMSFEWNGNERKSVMEIKN